MAMKTLTVMAMALLAVLPLFFGLASADRCGIPFDQKVTFDEHAQNAIAAWNGTEEVLLLSTDLRSANPGRLLEFLALPSAPTEIKEGNISSFKTMTSLFNRKMEWLNIDSAGANTKAAGGLGAGPAQFSGITILFTTEVGPHGITVVKMENGTHFAEWVRSFAASEGIANFSVSNPLNKSVSAQISRGLKYFVFDTVDVDPVKKTSSPLIYRFNTTYCYYPVDLTAATLNTDTRNVNAVNLFLVMAGVPRSYSFSPLHERSGTYHYISFSRGELTSVCPEIAALFPGKAFVSFVSGTPYRYYSGYNWLNNPGSGIEDAPPSMDISIHADKLYIPTRTDLDNQEKKAQFEHTFKTIDNSLLYHSLEGTVSPGSSTGPDWLVLILGSGTLFIALLVVAVVDKGLRLRRPDAQRKVRYAAAAVSGPVTMLVLWLIPIVTPTVLMGMFCFPTVLLILILLVMTALGYRKKKLTAMEAAWRAESPGQGTAR